jgi:hypothetical protein
MSITEITNTKIRNDDGLVEEKGIHLFTFYRTFSGLSQGCRISHNKIINMKRYTDVFNNTILYLSVGIPLYMRVQKM